MSYLEEVMNQVKAWTDSASSVIPSVVLELQEDGGSQKFSLSDLWWNLRRVVDSATTYEETAFLAFSAIDAYLERLPWLYPVTLHQLAENEAEIKSIMCDIAELRKSIQASDSYKEWDNIQNQIRKFASENGLSEPDVNSLSEITPILLDAMQVPAKWGRQQWRCGADAKDTPIIYWNMPRYRYVSDFVDSLSFGRPCCIAFGMIEPLVRDYNDPMLAAYGESPELIRNARNRGEAELDKVWGGYAVIGVKRGKSIWVLRQRLSWDEMPYGRTDSLHYGRRVSYMPYQVTYRDTDMQPGLMVRDKPAWDLRAVLDKEQVIWLPIMAIAVQKEFFGDTPPSPLPLHVDSRTIKIIGASSTEQQENRLATTLQTIDRPSAFAGNPAWSDGNYLLAQLGITESVAEEIPISLPLVQAMTIGQYQQELIARVRLSVACEAKKRLTDLFSKTEYQLGNIYTRDAIARGALEVTSLFREAVIRNMNNIVAMLNDPENQIYKMTDVIIDGYQKDVDTYGRPILSRTSIEDGRSRPFEAAHAPKVWQFFPQTICGKRPPVAIKIIPETAQQVATLMGIDFGQLDWRIRFWNCNKQLSDDPVLRIDNPYNRLHFSINMAFAKREFKTLLPNTAKKYQKK